MNGDASGEFNDSIFRLLLSFENSIRFARRFFCPRFALWGPACVLICGSFRDPFQRLVQHELIRCSVHRPSRNADPPRIVRSVTWRNQILEGSTRSVHTSQQRWRLVKGILSWLSSVLLLNLDCDLHQCDSH